MACLCVTAHRQVAQGVSPVDARIMILKPRSGDPSDPMGRPLQGLTIPAFFFVGLTPYATILPVRATHADRRPPPFGAAGAVGAHGVCPKITCAACRALAQRRQAYRHYLAICARSGIWGGRRPPLPATPLPPRPLASLAPCRFNPSSSFCPLAYSAVAAAAKAGSFCICRFR